MDQALLNEATLLVRAHLQTVRGRKRSKQLTVSRALSETMSALPILPANTSSFDVSLPVDVSSGVFEVLPFD